MKIEFSFIKLRRNMVVLTILVALICLFVGLVVGVVAGMIITYAALMDKLDDKW